MLPRADYFINGIPVFQIKIHPSIVTSGSSKRLFAIMARSRTRSDSTLRSKSSYCLYRVFNFIPVFESIPADGFRIRSSALMYSHHTLARRLPWRALATTAHAPSAYCIRFCFIAILPHSAMRSYRSGESFAACAYTAGSSEIDMGAIVDIRS